jgi:ribosome-binding ATPase
MPLSIGIVGLPNVGKSTLFNTLTKKGVEASNYPFCTIEPNVGIVKVPDERLDKIAEVSKPKQIVPTIIEFIDIAGLVKGAHEGEGLGNKFLSHIRKCDAICEIVRDFENENIIHVNGRIDPDSDRETIETELILADLQSAEKRCEKLSKEAKSGNKETIRKAGAANKLKTALAEGIPARKAGLSDEEKEDLKDLNLITLKPIIYVLNQTEEKNREYQWEGELISLNIKQEEEIMSLSEEERQEFINELGLKESGLDKLIKSSYRLLNLISFFTTGPDETRAWTVENGAKAPRAAGVIHSDFEKKFIRAEVIGWEKFIEAGSEAVAREKGWIRTEGKEYIMQDGDICHFLHS